MVTRFLSDNLLNASGSDQNFSGSELPVAPSASHWHVAPTGGAPTFTKKAAIRGLVDTTSTTNDLIYINPLTDAGNINVALGPANNVICQVGMRCDANDGVAFGVGEMVNLLSGIDYCYLARLGGVLNVYSVWAGLLGAVPAPSGSDYCLRLIGDQALNTVNVFVANMTEGVNPNASFTKIATAAAAVLDFSTIVPLLAANNVGAQRAGGSGFYSPQYSDGSYPFQALWQTFDNGIISNPQITFSPYANGWIGTGLFDFSLSGKYSVTLPTSLNDARVVFSSIEVSNVGNPETVVVTIGGRKTQIPGDGTVVLNLDAKQYPQLSLSSASGACRLTVYAQTDVNYQTFR